MFNGRFQCLCAVDGELIYLNLFCKMLKIEIEYYCICKYFAVHLKQYTEVLSCAGQGVPDPSLPKENVRKGLCFVTSVFNYRVKVCSVLLQTNFRFIFVQYSTQD